MNLNKVLEEIRSQKQEEDLEQKKEGERFMREMKKREELARQHLFPNLRIASVKDYLLWLKGYMENGGRPTHVYDYPLPQREWYVAIREIEPIELYGADAINIIIPANVSTKIGDWGHCELFYMDGYRPSSTVPIFKDTHF